MLGTNFKLKKENTKYLAMGLSLSPHKISGYNVCSSSTPECRKHCINFSGGGMYPAVQLSRIEKTKRFFEDRKGFLGDLHKSIEKAIRKAEREKLKLALRLNVFSDIMWEQVDKSLFEFPIQFYDYTKHIKRYQRFLDGGLPDNYHLCFSRSETNDKACENFLENGGQVNYVFHKLPKTYLGYRVKDGDKNDFRFLDGPGVIGVTSKGTLKSKPSPFVAMNHLLESGKCLVSV